MVLILLEILISDPVCVVAIVGPCRDGKSFILSETFGQADVFPVGYETDPKTMGVWMWILPQKMQVCRVHKSLVTSCSKSLPKANFVSFV